MKLYLASLFVLIQISRLHSQEFTELVDKYKADMQEIQDSCIEETGVDPVLIQNALAKGDFVDNDMKLKCFFKCIYFKVKLFDEAGNIDEEILRTRMGVQDKTVSHSIISKCRSINDEDLCERAYKLSKCVYLTTQEHTEV